MERSSGERRRQSRTRKRIACGVVVDGRRHSGIVLDVSDRGLFVQTSARPRPGTEVDVVLNIPSRKESVTILTVVARQKLVPPQLLTVAQGGIGLQLREDPPVAYHDLLEEMGLSVRPIPSRKKPAAERVSTNSAKVQLRRFRVSVESTDGSESNTFLVTSGSEEGAREKVLADIGEGWKVIEVEAG